MHAVAEHSDGWHQWRRRRLRRSWIFLTVAGLSLLPGVAAMVVALRLDDLVARTDQLTEGHATAIGLPWVGRVGIVVAVIHGILALTLLRSGLRDRALVRRVVETDGCVCPRCGLAMRLAPTAGTPESLDDRDLTCDRCDAVLPAGAVRRYWEQSLVSPLWAQQWKAKHLTKGRFAQLMVRMAERSRRRPKTAMLLGFVSGVIVLVVYVVVSGLVAGASIIGGLVSAAPVFVVLGAAAVIAVVMRPTLETDDMRRCADCDYEQPATGAIAERCPECGGDWHRVGGTTVGRPTKARRPTATSLLLFAIVMIVCVFALNVNRLVQPILPTPALIALLSTGAMSDRELVARLEGRKLDAAARQRLARRLVDLRVAHEHLDPALEELLERFFLAGELDDVIADDLTRDAAGTTLRDRYLEAAMTATIEGPVHARPGEQITLAVVGTSRTRPFSAVAVHYVWGGWRVDGGEPIGRGESIASGFTLWRPATQTRGSGAPALTMRAPSPRTVTVRGDLWVVVEAAGLPKRGVRWSDDDVPTIEDPAPMAIFPIHLQRVITIQ